MGHRTTKIIARLGVRWLALVEAQGPENSLTTNESRRLCVGKGEKKEDGRSEKAKGSTKEKSAKKM